MIGCQVVKALAKGLKSFNPFVNINLASYKINEVYEKWYNIKLSQLSQPEIDLITCHDNGRILHASEVKYSD